MVDMSKETAMKPIERIANYLKYGFVITEHQYMDCPSCSHTLNAGPNYQPKYCDQCGQRVSFKGIIWKEDRHLGYISEKEAERDAVSGKKKKSGARGWLSSCILPRISTSEEKRICAGA